MAYSIVLSNGSVLTTVSDNTVDHSTTALALVGRNYPGYGAFIANDFVHLLENFASGIAPDSPLAGQLWWDSTNAAMMVWTGATPSLTVPANQWYAVSTGVTSVVGNTGAITLSQLIAGGV